jgi:hypothetical protein
MVKQTLCPLLIFKWGPPYVHHIAKVKMEPRTFLPFDQNTPMFVLREKATVKSKGGFASG